MIALQWLPLWSLIGPDEGLTFLIIIFTFFITISIAFKFRLQTNMSCTASHNFVAQEYMALTQNPFQFRLSPTKHETGGDEEKNYVVDKVDKDLTKELNGNKKSNGNNSDKEENYETKKNSKNIERENSNEINEKELNEAFVDDKPTTLENNQEQDDDFKKGIEIDILCKDDFYLCYYWGLNIDQFHNFMRLNSQSFNDRIFDGTLFDQSFLERNNPILVKGSNQIKTFKLTCSDKVNSDTLGQSPRTCYPLVVILARDLNNKNTEKNENDVMFMINVLHVKDRICPLETNVITRLLKKRNGLTINLQTLYTPSEFDEHEGANTAICVICQESLVSIALLPCRHACTCLECFTKIDKCPLCRSYIRSYFMLKFEENNQPQQENLPTDDQTTAPQTKENKSLIKKFKNWFRS